MQPPVAERTRSPVTRPAGNVGAAMGGMGNRMMAMGGGMGMGGGRLGAAPSIRRTSFT